MFCDSPGRRGGVGKERRVRPGRVSWSSFGPLNGSLDMGGLHDVSSGRRLWEPPRVGRPLGPAHRSFEIGLDGTNESGVRDLTVLETLWESGRLHIKIGGPFGAGTCTPEKTTIAELAP